MKQLLSEMNRNYKAENETEIYQAYASLVTPYYSECDEEILDITEDHKYQTLSYLLIQDTKIIEYSFEIPF